MQLQHRLLSIAVLCAAVLAVQGCTSLRPFYRDGRPVPQLRMYTVDQGVVLRHGSGPDSCDVYGARDVWVFAAESTYVMHYDGAGPRGWLVVQATSSDLLQWSIHGPVLDLGPKGADDEKSASYGVTVHDGSLWHMFYLGAINTSPAPDLVPATPYVTLKARSDTPFGPWVKQPEIVPFRPVPGTYYSHSASPGQTIFHNGEYLQFFSASVGGSWVGRTLGMARTRDLDSAWVIDPAPILPLTEQIENSALYYEEANNTWFLFTNHIGWLGEGEEYTDAIWVYWSHDPTMWNPDDKAIVLDRTNCTWSKRVIGLPSIVRFGNRLALFYDGVEGEGTGHMRRDIGLSWLPVPLVPPRPAGAGR